MTTEQDQQAERLAKLATRRTAPTDQRRAVIGKILATGLTSTTVFGITAALGWSATSASDDANLQVAPTEQMVLDLATGRLITYVDGVAVSAQQVMSPGQGTLAAPTSIPSLDLEGLSAINSAPSGVVSNLASPQISAAVPAIPATPAQPATSSVSGEPIADTPVIPTTEPATVVTIPVAIPQAPISGSFGGGGGGVLGGGGGGGSSSGS